jgi:VWFA-related protein
MSILPIALLTLLQATPAPAEAQRRELTVTVTDDKGRAIEGLTADDIAVLENGVAREVTRVELDRRPLTLAMIVDTSEPMGTFYRLQILDPVLQFLSRLPEDSKFTVWTTGDRPTRIVDDYSTDVAAASRALKKVFPRGGNTLFDTIVEASRDLAKREGERTAVVIVTGLGIGFRNYDRRQVVAEGKRSGATFLTLQFEEGRLPPGAERAGHGEVDSTDYDYVLSSLAKDSGGRQESTLSAMGVGSTLARLGADLRGQYRLSYLGLPGVDDPKVKVTVAREGAQVRVGTPRT